MSAMFEQGEEFGQIIGRGPDIAIALRETVEQALALSWQNRCPGWTLPEIGATVWDSFPDHMQPLVLGRLLDAYITEVHWSLVRQASTGRAIPSTTR